MENIYNKLFDFAVVPVIALDTVSKAENLAHALANGGLSVAEVTFRTACASEAIEKMRKAEPKMLIGAGTILNIEQAQKAIKSGAEFIVSPGYNPELVDWCLENKIPTIPGISNASEITACVNKGVTNLKLFPAERLGGYKLIDDFGGPFPQCTFMPTGGITIENFCEYLKRKNVLCVGGTWMVKKNLIEAENWSEIIQICRDSINLAKNIRENM